MPRLMCTVLALFATVLATTANAKQKTFSWINGMCEVSIRYDSAKVKDRPLQDTVYLLNEAYQNLYVSFGFVGVPDDIKRLDRDALNRRCRENQDRLARLELLDIPPLIGKLEPLRRDLMNTQGAICTSQDIHLRGYENPGALREYKGAPHCDSFIDALEDDSKLEPAWRAYVETLCANNASFADCSKRELSKASLPDAKAHMRITLLSFGWNNCTNPSAWAGSDALQTRLQDAADAMQKHFKAKAACEEP